MGDPPIFDGVRLWNYAAIFSLMAGGAAYRHIGSVVFVSPEPFSCLVLRLFNVVPPIRTVFDLAKM